MAHPMENQNDRPPLATPRSANPFGDMTLNSTPKAGGALAAAEMQRQMAEVTAAVSMAMANPRDPIRAMERIINACCRPTLAKAAKYQYARGGNSIMGETIRLMESIGQNWGNIHCGVTELARHDGYSECVAYAWDLETNFRDNRHFQVRHWRDTKQGGYRLTDERDIYELIANMGARRKRAALQTVIPGDVIEAASNQCEATMRAHADTSPAGIKKILDAFAEFGVTQPQIETRIQRRLDAIQPAQVVVLEKIYNSLRDGMSAPADWFDEPTPPPLAEPGTPAAATTTAPAGRRGRRAAAAGTPEPQAPPQREPPPPGPADEPPPRDEPHDGPPPRQQRQVRFEV